MKLTVERATLLAAITRAARIIEKRNTIPVLGNVLLTAEAGRLTLRATDLDLDLVSGIAADVHGAGSATVPGHMLADIVRKLPDGCQIALEQVADGRMVVKAGRSLFRLSTIPAEDFPNITTGDLAHTFTLPAKDLKGLIDRTTFAISTEETRYYLNGIFLHMAAEALRGVATDGHRLAQVSLADGTGAAAMPGVIMPRKTVGEVARLLGDMDGPVTVSLSEQKIRFTFGGGALTLTSKLIDGTFPDYTRVVPTACPLTVIAEKDDLAAAIDRVMTVASDRGRAVKCALAGRTMTLSATSAETGGEAVEEIEVDTDPGTEVTIGFNGRYLTDILGQVAGDTVRLRLTDAGSPALIEDVASSRALFVLMPMRV